MFQIAHADAELWADRITPRTAMDLFGLLRRPATGRLDDRSHGIAGRSRHAAFLGGVRALVPGCAERNDHDAALEISDLAPASPLLFNVGLRWAVEGVAGGSSKRPTTPWTRPHSSSGRTYWRNTPPTASFPWQARQIREQILKMPLVATDQETARKQSQRFAELAAVSAERGCDHSGNGFARRGRGGLVFPVRCAVPNTSKSDPQGDCDAAFFNAGGEYCTVFLAQPRQVRRVDH